MAVNPIVETLRTAPSPKISIASLTHQRCPCCGHEAHSVIRYPAFVSRFFSGLILACCDYCGSGWVPIPDLDLDTYYRKHYAEEFRKERLYQGKFFGDANPVWSMEKHPVRDRARKHARILRRFRPDAKDVLDIGCGEGILLYELDPPRKFALESDENVQGILRNEVGAKIIDAIPEKPSFDVVVASHVIEHFTYQNVGDYISAIYKALRPGGVFLVEVPDGASQLEVFEAGNRPPTQRLEPHTLFFSTFAMNMMLMDAGFEMLQSMRCRWTSARLDRPEIRDQVPEDIIEKEFTFVARKPGEAEDAGDAGEKTPFWRRGLKRN